MSLRFLFIALGIFASLSQAEPLPDVAPASVAEPSVTELRLQHFANIDELVSLRAPGLALSYLEREQPAYQKEDPAEWLLWEQKRILLLKYMQRSQAIVDRVEQYRQPLQARSIATADRNWFLTEQLRALIALGQNAYALKRTRQLLWSATARVKSQTLAAWRRLVIQIYIRQQKTSDAQIAMRRYQQDYGALQDEDGLSWLQLQAELLIQLGDYAAAVQLLQQIDSDEARGLQLLTMLKDNAMSPLDAYENAQLVLSGRAKQKDAEEQAMKLPIYEYISIVTSLQQGKTERAIVLLERFIAQQTLSIDDNVSALGGLTPDVNTLWTLYLKQGHAFANQQGLLKGNDEAWYTLASNLYETQPVMARSLFAVLSLQASQLHHRQLAMKQLAGLVEKEHGSLLLINQLFTDAESIADVNQVPAEVRYKLIDYNLARGEIGVAASLMADLQQPPQDQPQFDWNLRRARVLILSGSFNSGAAVLADMLDQPLEQGQADKYLQVVFDLQAVEQHALALDLFWQLQQKVDSAAMRREITFWRAESYAGLKQFDRAAYLFMKSAISPENVYDPWYHTATFRAAESLMDAGLLEDARQRFTHLLKITGNAARKAVIRQRLQSIQLKSQKPPADKPIAGIH